MEKKVMKKDLIFAPVMLIIGVLLFLLRATGMTVHIAVAVIGIFVLAAYTAATKKTWKLIPLEIIMRACYGIALITGPVVMKLNNILAVEIIHKAAAAVFALLLVVLFVHKLIVNKKAKN